MFRSLVRVKSPSLLRSVGSRFRFRPLTSPRLLTQVFHTSSSSHHPIFYRVVRPFSQQSKENVNSEDKQEEHKEQEKQQGGFWNLYNTYLESHPLVTKMVTSAILVGAGDLFCQSVIEHQNEIDWFVIPFLMKFVLYLSFVFHQSFLIVCVYILRPRVGRMTFVGAALIATHLHFW